MIATKIIENEKEEPNKKLVKTNGNDAVDIERKKVVQIVAINQTRNRWVLVDLGTTCVSLVKLCKALAWLWPC